MSPKASKPAAGSVILVGIALNLGTYGFLRFSIPMFPEETLCSPILFIFVFDSPPSFLVIQNSEIIFFKTLHERPLRPYYGVGSSPR